MRPKNAFILAFCLILAACGSNETGSVDDTGPAADQRREMLAAVGNEVIAMYGEFDVETANLETAVAAWAADPTVDNRLAAQEAWTRTMAAWQQAEVTQFGPAGPMSAVVGGEDLRDRIYSWPLTNPCRVDQETVSEGYAAADFADERLNVKGLDALEYLLFTAGTENQCSPNSTINTDGSWAALDATTIEQRRADYAAVLAADLSVSSDELLDWWTGERNFEQSLATAGAESEIYPTSQEALNAVSDALFYLDKETKDMKVGPPAGLMSTCTATTCPELRESLFASVSIAHIRQNIVGFERVYLAGFDPLLRAKGAVELADQMLAALDATKAAFADLDENLETMLASDLDAVIDAHDKLREFIILFRTQFLSVLDLELPDRAEGDND